MAVSFKEYFEDNEVLLWHFQGRSMLPLLREGKDTVVLSRAVPGVRYKKYDVILYEPSDCGSRRPGYNSYVLHRIVKVLPDSYVVYGDNTYVREVVTDGMIIASLTGIKRGSKSVSLTSFGYRLYVILNRASYPVRYLCWIVRKAIARKKNQGDK